MRFLPTPLRRTGATMVATSMILCQCVLLQGQDTADDSPAEPDQATLFQQFEDQLTNAKLVGQFTIVGKDRAPASEEYRIRSVKKLPRGDYWSFNARIQYGDKDLTVPLVLEVKWAGDTPIITLSDLTIPLLGTFSARVVIDDGKYAGTWRHGEAHGHLYGVIQPDEAVGAGSDAP